MQTTNVLGLKKPEKNEFYHVEDFNNNSDVMDALFEKDANGSVMAKNAKTLDGHESEYFASAEAVNKKSTLDAKLLNTSILEEALSIQTNGVHEYILGGTDYTADDIPSTGAYAYSNATIKVRYNFREIILWGVNGSAPMYNAYSSSTGWSGWKTLATRDDLANYLPLSDLGGAKILTALPSGITDNSTMQELIDALPSGSILKARRVMKPLAPKDYTTFFISKENTEHVIAFAKSQYDNFIHIGGIGTDNKWQGWTELNLANYLPLDGSVAMKKSIAIGDKSAGTRTVALENSLRDFRLELLESGNFRLRDFTGNATVMQSNLNGTNTFNGTATGNLPLTGGTVGDGTSTAPLKIKGNVSTSYIQFVNNANEILGYLGLYSATEPAYIPASGNVVNHLLHTGNFPVEEGTFNLTYGSVVLSGFKYIKMGKFVYLYGGCSTPSTFTVPSMKSLSGIPFTPYASAHSYVVMTNDTYSPSNDANKTHVFGIGSAGITLADETTFNVGEPITLTAMYVTA